jgi:hypothetical protein
VGRDELEETWLALTLPSGVAASLPLDATIMAAAEPAPTPPLPRISVSEPGLPIGRGSDLSVLRLLGEGGMGRVQLARQESLDREVALKRPHTGAGDPDAQLLRAEALVTGHLEHPNIVPVHALGVDDAGQPLIVMKRVEGVGWRDLMQDPAHPGWASREPDPEARLVWHLQVLAQLCNAIAFANSRGVVHRDMKPGNVMVGAFGEVYLIDWGIAISAGGVSRTESGSPILVGTPAYMAPEMARGGPFDAQTDVYLLGATLHEIVTGRVRHLGGDLHQVVLRALRSSPIRYPDQVPTELADLANRATSVDPSGRPPGALAFRQALVDHLRHRGSLRLSGGADRNLAALEADPATGGDRAIEECRFGYREALREWPENPDALGGLERCTLATASLEIGRRNPAAARAAVAELSTVPAELTAALIRLESELADEEAERDRLRDLARDEDPAIGARGRGVMLAAVLLGVVVISLYSIQLSGGPAGVGRAHLIGFPAALACVAVALLVALRRRVAVNAFNRRLAAWFLVLVLTIVGNRVVGQSLGVAAASQYALDGVLIGTVAAAGAIFLFRWLWLSAGLLAVGAAVATAHPPAALIALVASSLGALAVAAIFLRQR